MFGLFVVVAVAALITSLVCLGSSHRIAAAVAGLVGIGAFLLANTPVPDGVAAANPSERSICQPDSLSVCGDDQCR